MRVFDLYKSFQKQVQAVLNVILINVVYFVGLGITAVFGRVLHKQFLLGADQHQPLSSTWVTHTPSLEPERMY